MEWRRWKGREKYVEETIHNLSSIFVSYGEYEIFV
jgi:hypothetical protein